MAPAFDNLLFTAASTEIITLCIGAFTSGISGSLNTVDAI